MVQEIKVTPVPIAFNCRAKPQECDAFTIFEKACRVFIGHPLIRLGREYDPKALGACLVDPSCSETEWEEQTAGRSSRNFTRNRNFVARVTDGSIVVIPRPNLGVAFLARVVSPFEIVNNPSWAQDYLKLRAQQRLDRNDKVNHHIADVAQGWRVDRYRPIPLPRLPGWLKRSLFGRSTYNVLRPHPLDEGKTAYSVLHKILEGCHAPKMPWTLELDAIKKRLVDTLSNPYAFENLIVELLQLEHPNELWQHTGGPGDGGIDGLGSNKAGDVVGLMQAKYFAKTAPELGNLTTIRRRLRRYSAVLAPENPSEPTDGTCLLNLDWIACAVRRHWRRLPLAVTMRVGRGTD